MKLLAFVIAFLTLHTKSELIGCGDKYDRATWDCDEYRYYFSQDNLDKTLYCIGHDKMVPVKRALNLSNPVDINVERKIWKINELDVQMQTITFVEIFVFRTLDLRLEFKHDTCSMTEYPPDFLYRFLPAYVFTGNDIDSDDFKSLLLTKEGEMQFYGKRTKTQRCEMDLRRFPFDRHTCTIGFEIGLSTQEYTLVAANEIPLMSDESLDNPDWKITASNITIEIKTSDATKKGKCL